MTDNLAALVDVFGKLGLLGVVFIGVPLCLYMFARETIATTTATRRNGLRRASPLLLRPTGKTAVRSARETVR